MSHRYPILLDVTRARIVIVGGGKVAARKAAGLIESGATDLTVVSPDIAGDFAASVKVLRRPYAADVLTNATLVFAATNSESINTQIVEDAQSRAIFVNRADADTDPTGDFVTPAKFVEGDVTVTVSAGSAALAVTIRDNLRDHFDPCWTAMAAAMQTLRPWLRDEAGLTPEQRAAAFRKLVTPEAFDRLHADGVDGLRIWITRSIRSG